MHTTGAPTLIETHAADDKPLEAALAPALFKLKLSIPGRSIGGQWLCRLTGAALAYQNYCGTRGTPRIFSWYRHGNGKSYLKDQEGNWLSWEVTANCLYMSTWGYSAAWRLEGGRLVRDSDNAVVSYNEKQRWPLANEKFLQAFPPSADAVTVEQINESGAAVAEL